MAKLTVYRVAFATGLAVFFGSTAAGLGYALFSEHKLPMVEIEDRLPHDLEDFYAFATMKPRNPIALVFLGDALMKEGNHKEALRVFEQAVKLQATPITANERLVTLYLRQGRMEMARRQARAVYRKGGELDDRTLRQLNMVRKDAR